VYVNFKFTEELYPDFLV